MAWKDHTYESTGKKIDTKLITECQIKDLINKYPINSNKYLGEIFNCSRSFLQNFARYYNLSKDKEWLSNKRREILVHRNKNITGRNLTPETLKEIALGYSTKREFQELDSSAYTTANRIGIMEDISKHMVNFSFSVPQIITKQLTEFIFKQKCEYDTRKIIAPYELDIYFPDLRIAFEYDGKGWHLNDKVNKKELCKNKDILLITISERNRKYLNDIKKQILENLDTINSWCNTEIAKKDIANFYDPIDFPVLFTKDELKILRSNTTRYLRKTHLKLYEKYKKYNPDGLEFDKIIKERKKWDEESVKKGILTYKSTKEMLEKNRDLYGVIHKKYRHFLPLYNKTKNKPVVCTCTGETFESITEASLKLNIPHTMISKVCNGKRTQTYGKKFKFL